MSDADFYAGLLKLAMYAGAMLGVVVGFAYFMAWCDRRLEDVRLYIDDEVDDHNGLTVKALLLIILVFCPLWLWCNGVNFILTLLAALALMKAANDRTKR